MILCMSKIGSKLLNSTPTNTSTWPFITFPHSSGGEGQGSVFVPFKFQRMFGKGLECAISGDTSSPCGGKPQCWFTVKALVEWVTKHHIPGVGALRSVCILDIPLPALSQITIPGSVMKLKIHDEGFPPTKRVDESTSISVINRTQQLGYRSKNPIHIHHCKI